MSFLTFSNSSYYVFKLMGKNSDVYRPTVEENLSVPPSKPSIKSKVLLLAMQHYTYIRKTG